MKTERNNMQTIPASITKVKVKGTVRYAYYGDDYGTATLLIGSGYLFRRDGERQARVVSFSDPALVLLGLVEMADAQYAADLRAREGRS
jgi:hypothetical protein